MARQDPDASDGTGTNFSFGTDLDPQGLQYEGNQGVACPRTRQGSYKSYRSQGTCKKMAGKRLNLDFGIIGPNMYPGCDHEKMGSDKMAWRRICYYISHLGHRKTSLENETNHHTGPDIRSGK